MSINDATRFDWDRIREAHPPLELEKETVVSQTLLEKYIALADEEQRQQDLLNSVWDEEQEEEEDMVGAPKHYNSGNIECIDAIEESMSSHAFKGYLKGNCMKYLWRYDYKGKQVEDLQKAGWYLRKLTDMVTEENN